MRFARRTNTDQINTLSTDCNFSTPLLTAIDKTNSSYGVSKSEKSDESLNSHNRSETNDKSDE
jgi:hypothetical protein